MTRDTFSATVCGMRPSVWPLIWIHALTGFVLAHGRGMARLYPDQWLHGLVAGGVWAVCLGGAAIGLATLYRAVPRDERDAADFPAQRPIALGWAAAVLLLIGLAASPVLGWRFFDVYLVGVMLAVVTTVPPLALGRLVAGDFVLRAVGLGGLTLHAGYCLAQKPLLPPPTFLSLIHI